MGNPIPSRDARPLRWYKPTDHPQDNEHALWMAHGIGGRYSIQSDLDKFIVWHAADEFSFTTCDTIEACKEWAEADWQTAIRALSDRPDSTNEGLAELLREALADIENMATYRIQDGIEMGATVWKIALEDIARDAREALDAKDQSND